MSTLKFIVAGNNKYRVLGLTDEEHASNRGPPISRQIDTPIELNEREKRKQLRRNFNVMDMAFDRDVIKQRFTVSMTSLRSNSSSSSSSQMDDDSSSFASKCIKKVICGPFSSYFVMQDGSVYACGDNSWGLLATGNKEHVRGRPVLCKAISACGMMKDVIPSVNFAFFIAENGQVYGFGNNRCGQLTGSESHYVEHPVFIDPDELFEGSRITKVQCGLLHTAFLTENGNVWLCGSNSEEQLGLDGGDDDNDDDDEDEDNRAKGNRVPRVLKMGQKKVYTTDVCCGSSHTVVLLKNGEVVAFGSSKFGQCGEMTSSSDPHVIQKNVSRIWAGSNSTLMLTNQGELFACGNNMVYQMGTGGDQSENMYEVQELDSLPFNPVDIQDITIGGSGTFVTLKGGEIYYAGANRYGQSLINAKSEVVKTFEQVQPTEEYILKHFARKSNEVQVKVSTGESHSIMYFVDQQKTTSALQWFGTFKHFSDAEIIFQSELDLEPESKRRRLL